MTQQQIIERQFAVVIVAIANMILNIQGMYGSAISIPISTACIALSGYHLYRHFKS